MATVSYQSELDPLLRAWASLGAIFLHNSESSSLLHPILHSSFFILHSSFPSLILHPPCPAPWQMLAPPKSRQSLLRSCGSSEPPRPQRAMLTRFPFSATF